ncbi:MAG: alpha/beta hydrolase [Acidimicrobiales bacterium]
MVHDRVVDVGDVRLTISEAGVGGRPLLLLHGFTGARNDFTRWIEPLAERGWHVVVPDHRGHGDSDKPEDESAYAFEIFAADALALVDALGWDGFALLGHSMGGMVAQVLTLMVPDRVAALILMDTSHKRLRVDPGLVELGVSTAREHGVHVIADLQAEIDDPLTSDAYRRLCEADPDYAARGDRNLRASSPAMYAAMLHAITSEGEDRLDLLAEVRCPALVLVGDQDAPFRRPSERMAATLPDARLVVLPDAGHSPQFESPEAWWAAMSGFLDEVADQVAPGAVVEVAP